MVFDFSTGMVCDTRSKGYIDMDQNRREFFRNLGSKSAILAAGAAAPAMVYMDS